MAAVPGDQSKAIPPLAGEDHVCAECGLSYPTLTIETATAIIASLPGALDSALGDAPPPDLRRRPRPGHWSALEYVFHLRDVCVTYTIRVHRARTEDRPSRSRGHAPPRRHPALPGRGRGKPAPRRERVTLSP